MITEFIITSATVLSAFSVASEGGSSSPYYYNASYEDGQVATMDVLQPYGQYLHNKLKYKFTYNSDGRLVEKRVMTWDDWSNKWHETEILHYDYTADSIILTLMRDKEHKGVMTPVEKYLYTMINCKVMAIDIQRWDSRKHDMVSIEKMLWVGSMDKMIADVARK